MSIMSVNPTRMQLKNLKNRLAVATRGHKLLKDKSDELIRIYTSLVKRCLTLRQTVEKRFLTLLDERK